MTWAAVTVGWKENSGPPIASWWAGYNLVSSTQKKWKYKPIYSTCTRTSSVETQRNWVSFSLPLSQKHVESCFGPLTGCSVSMMLVFLRFCAFSNVPFYTAVPGPTGSPSYSPRPLNWFWTKALMPGQALYTECGWCNV